MLLCPDVRIGFSDVLGTSIGNTTRVAQARPQLSAPRHRYCTVLQAVDLVEQEEGETEAWELRGFQGRFVPFPHVAGPRDVGRPLIPVAGFGASGALDKMVTAPESCLPQALRGKKAMLWREHGTD